MSQALLADIGSTYTKVTLVDLEARTILRTAKSFTTVSSDITTGLEQALGSLGLTLQALQSGDFKYKLACSSAHGGLKMVAIGLVTELTVEAAKRAALGAGARLLKVYANKLIPQDVQELLALKPDIILLAGGTNGGNAEVIIHNARQLGASPLEAPIVLAGNKVALPELESLLEEAHKDYYPTENVMPELNQLNIEPCRKTIRQIFLQKIIEAKGLRAVEALMDQVLMPTPAAVLQAAAVLSQGCSGQAGLGELLLVDIGGATTDVYSIAAGIPTKAGVNLRGLPEPYAKRTVEGDIGMRYSAVALCESLPQAMRHIFANDYQRLLAYAKEVQSKPQYVAQDPEAWQLETLLGQLAVEMAVRRHAGYLEVAYTPFGAEYLQYGKDLTGLRAVVGTGGVLVNHHHPDVLLGQAFFNEAEPTSLRPQTPELYLDQHYILASMGLLSEQEPEIALHIMKQGLKHL